MDKKSIYFDSAATSQMPKMVVEAIANFYENLNAPVYRGVYKRSENVTSLYESARLSVSKFINSDLQEVIFVKSATEGINFICSTWALDNLTSANNIILSYQEHHSNLLPWIELANRIGFKIKYIELNSDGSLNYEHYLQLLDSNTKLVACTYVSNVLGIVNNIKFMSQVAKAIGAKFLVDAAQAAGHIIIDVADLDVDFLVFSAHKMLGPAGIGILYISKSIQDSVRPYQLGGNTITDIDLASLQYISSSAPTRYEAGTQPVALAVGLATAIKYYNDNINFESLRAYLILLSSTLINELLKINKIRIISPTDLSHSTGHIVSFIVDGWHGHDLAAYLDQFGISIRAGFHCAKPFHDFMNLHNGCVRVSFHYYNSIEEVHYFIDVLKKISIDS